MSTLREQYPTLLEPELIANVQIGSDVLPSEANYRLDAMHDSARRVEEAAADIPQPPVLVHVQGRLVPNADEHDQVEAVIKTARSIRAQQYSGSIAIAAAVDREGFRPSCRQGDELAKLGVSLHKFGSISSLPAAFADVGDAIERRQGRKYELYGSLTAGNRFATNQALRAGACSIGNGAIACYGPLLPGNERPTEAAKFALESDEMYEFFVQPRQNPPCKDNNMGFMHDAGVMMRGDLVREVGLNLAYGHNAGAFREWVHQVRATQEGTVWFDPALAIHDARSSYLQSADISKEMALLADIESKAHPSSTL